MSIFSTFRRGTAPKDKPICKAAAIALARNEPVSDEMLEAVASLDPGQLGRVVATYQARDEAAKQLAEVHDLKKRELELLAERDAKREAVANADPPPRRLLAELYDAGRAYLAAKDERARLEDAATRTLVQTADPAIDERLAACEANISFHRTNASLSEDDAADLAHAESEVESLPEMIARASGAEAVNLRIRLMEAEAKLEDLKPRMAEVAAARREVKRLEREQQAIAAERLVPENFALTD